MTKDNPTAMGEGAHATVNFTVDEKEIALHNLEQARDSLSKLPILGPAMWLYSNAPDKKFMFVGDMQWLLLPPIILDQCRIYTKNGIPWAFITWAKVSDAIHERLSSGIAKLAPHEWNSGSHVWLIDTVAPFGGVEACIDDLRTTILANQHIHGFSPDLATGKIATRQWMPAPPATTPAPTPPLQS
jgi:cytolysin-activating lysine-acyltransferase